jgi:hypothetical protein
MANPFYNPMKKKEDERFRWLDSKWDQKCTECEEGIFEGEKILYDFVERKAYCESCGEEWLIK